MSRVNKALVSKLVQLEIIDSLSENLKKTR